MAALAPVQFQFPPIRYSPIQEAFRGALDIGLAELFKLPFEKLAQKREIEKFGTEQRLTQQIGADYIPVREMAQDTADINTGRLVPTDTIDPQIRSTFPRAGVTARMIRGREFITADDMGKAQRYGLPVAQGTQSFVDRARQLYGMKDQVGQPVTLGNFDQVKEGLGLVGPAAEFHEKQQEFSKLRADARIRDLQTPGPEFNQVWSSMAFQDPQTGAITRNYNDAFVFSKMPTYAAALQDPSMREYPEIKSMIEKSLARAKELRPVFMSSYMPKAEEIRDQLMEDRKAAPNAALSSHVALLARQASLMGLLVTPDGRQINPRGGELDMGIAIPALQGNFPLLEAMEYATFYGSMDRMQTAARTGGPIPINTQTMDYLRKIFPVMNPQTQSLFNDPNSPLSRPGANIGTGPAAGEQQPATPTSPGKNAALPAGQSQVLGTQPSTAAAPAQFVGSAAGRAMYNNVFTRVKADPTSFRAMSDSLEQVFKGSPDDVLNYFRKLAGDTTVTMSGSERTLLLQAVAGVDSLPANQKRARMTEIMWMARSMAQQAREDALGQALNPQPAAAGEKGEAGKEKPEEKKPKPKE